MNDYLSLLLGVVCAGVGGELFVRGVVGIARWARVSAGIVGVTLAAFATSSPELSVAISSSLAGTPEISLGDALGSNVINVALVLGIMLLIGSIEIPRQDIKREFLVALLAPILIGIVAFDGIISRLDGLLLLVIFFCWITAVTLEVRKQRGTAGEVLGEHRGGLAILYSISGLVLLIAAGVLIVTGAQGISERFGLNAFVIGAMIVAVGTSVPELATAVISRLRGHNEVGLSAVLGSNIFNGLFIIAVAALIHPITVSWREVGLTLLLGVVTLAVILPSARGIIQRWRGMILLALYVLFVILTI